MKRCSKCLIEKELEEFYREKLGAEGRCSICKVCRNIAAKEKYKKSHEERARRAQNHKKYRVKNKEALSRASRRWEKQNPEKAKNNNLMKRFGITLNDYNKLLEEQNGVCAICKKEEIEFDFRTGQTRCLAVDHCHTTQTVRGLLCGLCNKGLGLFKDDSERLKSAIQYLDTYNSP